MKHPLIRFYTPIPPMKSGTAHYFGILLAKILEVYDCRDQCEIVTDTAYLSTVPERFLGVRITDFRAVPSFSDLPCLQVFFIANNRFHAFVHQVISTMREHGAPERAGSKTITVVHEPCTYMLMKDLCGSGIYSFDIDQQIMQMNTQFGVKAGKFQKDSAAGNILDIFEYTSVGFSDFLRKSDEVWCHSTFAVTKLILEQDVAFARHVRLRVAAFPPYASAVERATPELRETLASRKNGFRIGLFGWQSPSKRVLEFLEGFSFFMDRRTAAEREQIELIIVGAMLPDESYPIASTIRRYNLDRHVNIHEFVADDVFAGLVGTCDLVGNLRYPSCGETSATRAMAAAASTAIITSSYQSFIEEPSDYRIPPIQRLEPAMVATAIEVAYGKWVRRMPAAETAVKAPDPAGRDKPARVDQLLALESFAHLSRHAARQQERSPSCR